MDNIFAKAASHNVFTWDNLGDIKEGRGDMGEEMPVLVYRLMQFTMLDILTKAYGKDQADDHFRNAGYLAGTEFAKNVLELKTDFNTFLANLQKTLQSLKVGILRMEAFNPDDGSIVLTVAQDLDCSGLPITNETVCYYYEAFISGIL
jgi:predicted hydrocarbon binding protein